MGDTTTRLPTRLDGFGRLSPRQIAVLYLVFGSGLLVVSDVLLPLVVSSSDLLRRIQGVEGAVEIVLTAALLYGVLTYGQADLRLKNEVVEEAPIGVSLSDPSRGDNPLVYVNDAFERLTGYDGSEVQGRNCRFLQGEDTDPRVVAEMRSAIDEERSVTVEVRNYRRDGTPFRNEVTIEPIRDEGGEVTHFVGFQRDVTERREREREWERSERRYRTLVEMAPNPVVVHHDGRITYTNDAFVDLVGADWPEDVVGTRLVDYFDPDERPEIRETARRVQVGEESPTDAPWRLSTAEGAERHVSVTSRPVPYEGKPAVLSILQDRTEQYRYHEMLKTLHVHTRELFTAEDDAGVTDAAIGAVEEFPDGPAAAVFEFDEEANALLPVDSVEPADADGWWTGVTATDGDPAWTAFETGETRRSYDGASHCTGLYIPVGTQALLAVEPTDGTGLSSTTIELCTILGANLEAALQRVERERTLSERDSRLERQRAALAELEELNATIRGINEAVLKATTRGTIESTVCDRLVARDAYSSVWIGRLAADGKRVVPTEAGATVQGLTDAIRAAEASSPLQTTLASAVTSGEVRYVARILDDPAWQSERKAALQFEFGSLVAVPIPIDGESDSVLVLHCREAEAVTDRQREVFGELGQLIGAALSRIGDPTPHLVGTTADVELAIGDDRLLSNRMASLLDAEVTLTGLVPVDDETLVQFVRTTAEPAAVADLVDEVSSFQEIEPIGDADGVYLYRVTSARTPFEDVLYEFDGQLLSMSTADGATTVRLRLRADRSVRDLVESLVDAYPDTELVARRPTETDAENPLTLRERVGSTCTDRQFQAIQLAYHGGYYEWPRDSTNEDLAAAMDISSPTFQSHRRAGERKLLSMVFDAPA